ncbi:hypothetical protein HHI36_019886 [Cryptolaemus montrouzieri]|uniref:AXH domain-containing protein n=1 Tax=Cryptolaemus montrouzieri TaxID=559131 RepID=A0ABD2N8N4_9CUCU
MISAGVDGRLPYMTYPEPWRGPPKQPPAEFLRPAPKPLSTNSRYNGIITSSSNGTRLAPPPRPVSKYPPQSTIITPVNLTQHKEETSIEDLQQFNAYARLFPHNAHFPHFSPYPSLYPHYAAHMMRQPNYPQTPLSPLETYSPTTPSGTNSSTFLSPSYSPPSILKSNQTIVKGKRTPPQTQLSQPPSPNQGFKVPSGKEGSLKHRILTRPEDVSRSTNPIPLDLQKQMEAPRKRLLATMSPPRSPKKSLNNNCVIAGGFAAGSLIQLANGELRRIEDMRTEDFISSAENNPELRLAESTVVKIEENKSTGNATITLSYNQRRTQVGVESTTEHPYFIYGQGWASYNPEKTLLCYGLKVNKLQVGDILVSLTPREPNYPFERTSTIVTTATTTSMTARQISMISSAKPDQPQMQPLNLHSSNAVSPGSLSPDSLAARKRRWSAPDQICEEDLNTRRHRGE